MSGTTNPPGAPSAPTATSSISGAASGYFVDQKKGEINELKQV